jgi:hypothetical protein
MPSSDSEEDKATVPAVRKAKTAFLFYQSDQLSKIRAAMGLSMGDAMTEVRKRIYDLTGLCMRANSPFDWTLHESKLFLFLICHSPRTLLLA